MTLKASHIAYCVVSGMTRDISLLVILFSLLLISSFLFSYRVYLDIRSDWELSADANCPTWQSTQVHNNKSFSARILSYVNNYMTLQSI